MVSPPGIKIWVSWVEAPPEAEIEVNRAAGGVITSPCRIQGGGRVLLKSKSEGMVGVSHLLASI